MALPPAFQDPQEYFEECFQFFIEYQHVYKYPNTDLLINDILNKIDIIGLENTDIFNETFNISQKPYNDYLNTFLAKLNRLKINYTEFGEDEDLELFVDVPLSPKKKHEIIYLAKEIGMVCKETDCETIVDLGSGLGYLDQQIFITNHLNVLGLECNENNYVGAKKRQRKYHLNSINNVKFIKHKVTDNSNIHILDYIKDKFNTKAFCICGLHACADLTIDAMNLFLKMEDACAIAIMPCCYHKIIQTDAERFKNFPLSKSLKRYYEKYNGFKFLNVPFLRLAAQPPTSERVLEDLVFSLLARATLQMYANQRNCILKRKKRKAVRLKSKNNDFESYVRDAITNGFSLISKQNNVDGTMNDTANLIFDYEELLSIWRQNSSQVTVRKAAIFILMQNYLQPVFENFILFDRLLYLHENGVENSEFKRIVNERISPRCFVLTAKK